MLGGAEQIRLYFQNLPSGVYVIEVQGSSGKARVKLVIAR